MQNLELKKLNDEKKAALAAQFAAEATLRRVQAAQKDEELPSIEAILAPVEAELKIARQEVSAECEERAGLAIMALFFVWYCWKFHCKVHRPIRVFVKLGNFCNLTSLPSWQIAKLQETNRALDRLTKSKEAALIEAERTIDAAEAKASQVDDRSWGLATKNIWFSSDKN